MTGIVAVRTAEAIYLAGDVRSSNAGGSFDDTAVKYRDRGVFTIAMAGWAALNQAILFNLKVPEVGEDVDPVAYLVKHISPQMRTAYKSLGGDDKQGRYDVTAMIVMGGEILRMDSTYHVQRVSRQVSAIGSGGRYLEGYIQAMLDADMHGPDTTEELIDQAFKSCAAANNTVSAEYFLKVFPVAKVKKARRKTT